MLTQEENERLTRVGRGTPMGELLRRYWHPVAAATEFDDRPTKAVRLFGEDLVLFRQPDGGYGLLDRYCTHRRADLSYGIVEEAGLRCTYHGWLFDTCGTCVQQPFEDTVNPSGRFKETARASAYRAVEHAGLVWAYLGPDPAPLVPDWEPFSWKNGFVQIVFAEIPCNWLQCQENSIDPVHFEWTHRNWSAALNGRVDDRGPTHVELGFDEFEFGLVYRRVLENTDRSDDLWAVGRVCLWPNCLFTGNHFEWRVPIDDTSTLSVTWAFSRVPRDREPYEQKSIPYWYGPITGPDGRWITSHIMNQDFVQWVGQGPIADRTKEHLGRSDRGIVLLRRRLDADLRAIAEGRDPSGLIRDPERNRAVPLPIVGRSELVDGLDRASWQRQREATTTLLGFETDYRYQYGQPLEVRNAWREAMGLEPLAAPAQPVA